MPYSTLAQIKDWLPGITGIGFDTELTNIQSDINRDIDRRLGLVTSLPIIDTTIKAELARYEARITSLWFKHRRAGAQERDLIMKEIQGVWEDFDALVANRFGYGVVVG